jgi:aspartyl-tRNA(Asn)/glutamyl-tRNA(Gln) amidotransferase subunit A
VLRSLGAEVGDVQLPYVQQCGATYTAIANSEAATVHYENLRVRPEKLGPIIRSRLDLGNAIPATAYVQAQQMRKIMRDGYREVFKQFDAIVGPASPTRAGKVNEEFTAATTVNGREVRNRELGEGYLNCYALAGLPALVLPAGFSSEGTPIGLQVAGRWFDEQTVLQVAHAFEQATDWHLRRPPNPSE